MRSVIKVALDIAMTIGFLALMDPKATGLPIHEWAGLGICAFFIVHKALNWKWIVAAANGVFSRDQPSAVRLNFIVDLTLLVGFTVIVISGMGMAKTIDFSALFPAGQNVIYKIMHGFAASLIVAGIGLHLGLHWNWIRARASKITAKEIRNAA